MRKNEWVEDVANLASFLIPLLLILLSVFVPDNLADRQTKRDLMTAGLTALVTGGLKTGRKVEVRQDVQTQEMNLAPSSDFVQYNPPRNNRNSYLSDVREEEVPYLEEREHIASTPYRVVNPDE